MATNKTPINDPHTAGLTASELVAYRSLVQGARYKPDAAREAIIAQRMAPVAGIVSRAAAETARRADAATFTASELVAVRSLEGAGYSPAKARVSVLEQRTPKASK